jgi:hypothetical protein
MPEQPSSKSGPPDEKTASGGSTPPLEPVQGSMDSKGSPAPRKLSKEEQLALYEKELKESDWGHQPC